MKCLIFIIIIFLSLFFSGNAMAGYAESQFSSLTAYCGGVVNIWQPADKWRYYVTIDMPAANKFKIYIPQGAEGNFDLYGHVGQGNALETFFIARAGQPPDSTRPSAGTVFSDDGFTLSQLNQDCYGTNSAGYLIIAKSHISSVLTTGIWVYVDVYHIEGGLLDMTAGIEVDQAAYAMWYNSALFGSDGDPSPSGTLPSPKPTPTPTPISTPVPTPIAKPTPKPTPMPSASCNVLFCTLSGGKCVGDICVPNNPDPTPIPASVVDVYQGLASGVPITIKLTHETDLTGSASLTVGEQTAPTIPYRFWEHDNIKTVYILDIGYLEIVGQTMKIDTFSGITLNKK